MTSRWFSPGPPVSSTNKTDRHDITEILLKVALNDRTGKLETGHGNAIPYVAARMDDSQESWREELDTRNDMGQAFSNEETDVRGEIRTPRERATELMRKGGMPLSYEK